MSQPSLSLRSARQAAHAAFDPLWRYGDMTRSQAYAWLAEQMKLAPEHAHMVRMSQEQCARVVALCQARAHELTALQFDVYD